MGLLSKLTDQFKTEIEPEDHLLLLHALMTMAGADAVLEESELDLLQAFWTTLPEFRGKSFPDEMERAEKMSTQYDTRQESVRAIGEIESEAVKKKCFVLCADMAMASGDVTRSEDELLETLQRILGIDDQTATKTLEVLAMKYAH